MLEQFPSRKVSLTLKFVSIIRAETIIPNYRQSLVKILASYICQRNE